MSFKKRPIESFKLHLSDLPNDLKTKLPVDYKKAITDYFREIGMVRAQKLF